MASHQIPIRTILLLPTLATTRPASPGNAEIPAQADQGRTLVALTAQRAAGLAHGDGLDRLISFGGFGLSHD